MEPAQRDPSKRSDMIMCGDHSSFTKTELNAKEDKAEVSLKDKLTPMSYAKITPPVSVTEEASERRTRGVSEHALRLCEARQRVRSLEAVPRPDEPVLGNRLLVQAALGSCRWPPYLVALWALLLLLTHALHCLAAVLDHSLPTLRKVCQYFRAWTEQCWKGETELSHRVFPLALACATGVLYVLYFSLCAVHCVAVWAIQPLLTDEDRRDVETKVTNYLDEVNSKTNSFSK